MLVLTSIPMTYFSRESLSRPSLHSPPFYAPFTSYFCSVLSRVLVSLVFPRPVTPPSLFSGRRLRSVRSGFSQHKSRSRYSSLITVPKSALLLGVLPFRKIRLQFLRGCWESHLCINVSIIYGCLRSFLGSPSFSPRFRQWSAS